MDWSDCPQVESVPGRLSGAWVLKDTRFPVRLIFENLELGASIDDVAEWYDVDREQVAAVVNYKEQYDREHAGLTRP